MLALTKVNFVLRILLALIATGSVVQPFINANWIRKFGLFIRKDAASLVLEGLVGHVHRHIGGQKADQIDQDVPARMDDDLFNATEMISLTKKEWKDAKTESKDLDCAEEENEHLKKKLEELQEALIQKEKTVESLNKQLAAKEQECEENRQQLQELQTRAVDDDFYCRYLEEKVKAHEAERKRWNQANTSIEEKSQTSEREVSVLERNPDVDQNQGKEMQKNPGLQETVHTQEDAVQLPQRKNKKKKKKSATRKQKLNVNNNSITVLEENKMKGNVFCQLGMLEQASECFLGILDTDENQADCRMRLGLCLLLLGRHSEAVVQLEKLDGREDLVEAAKKLQKLQRHGCPYYTLGVAEDATLKEIQWAYKKRALKFNPDKCQGSQEQRVHRKEVMRKVDFANDLLCDTDEREEYDAVRHFIKDLADKVFQDPQISREWMIPT